MSDEKEATIATATLLTAEERETCQRIAAHDDGVIGQRAAALLAVDEGMTRAQASVKTGLTPGQVGYAVTLLRGKGLAMFPDAPSGKAPLPTAAKPKKKASKKGKDKGKGKGKGKDKKKAKKGKDKKKAKAGKKKKK
jgi:hypothetical protein